MGGNNELDGFGTLVDGMNGKDINREKKTANVSLDNELMLIINEMETKKGESRWEFETGGDKFLD